MRLLIDGDTVIFKGLTAVQERRTEGDVKIVIDKYHEGIRACDFNMETILSKYDYPEFMIAISGKDNFRKKISPTYKSNRTSRPRYLHEVREYFKKYWGAVEQVGLEADDVLGIEHDSCTTLVVDDKDYKQLGGKIDFHWQRKYVEIDNPEYWFWLQMLVGDRTDMIQGLTNPAKLHHKEPPNFTDVTAQEILQDKSPEEMKAIVQSLYQQIHGDAWFEFYDTCARLIFLRRKNATEYFEIY
jgi:hypothetical protein